MFQVVDKIGRVIATGSYLSLKIFIKVENIKKYTISPVYKNNYKYI